MSATTASGSTPGGRVAVPLAGRSQLAAGAGAVVSLAYAAVLAWRPETDGIATAAVFGVGFLFSVFALTGQAPSSIKLGDVEVRMQRAREEGRAEGVESGLTAGAHLVRGIASKELSPETARAELRRALTSTSDLHVGGMAINVPQLSEREVRYLVASLEPALTEVAPRA